MASRLPCLTCGDPIEADEPFTVSHLTLFIDGGADKLDNVAAYHRECTP